MMITLFLEMDVQISVKRNSIGSVLMKALILVNQLLEIILLWVQKNVTMEILSQEMDVQTKDS